MSVFTYGYVHPRISLFKIEHRRSSLNDFGAWQTRLGLQALRYLTLQRKRFVASRYWSRRGLGCLGAQEQQISRPATAGARNDSLKKGLERVSESSRLTHYK